MLTKAVLCAPPRTGKRHRKLASYYVELDPAHPKSEDEVVALIKRRLRRFEPEALASLVA